MTDARAPRRIDVDHFAQGLAARVTALSRELLADRSAAEAVLAECHNDRLCLLLDAIAASHEDKTAWAESLAQAFVFELLAARVEDVGVGRTCSIGTPAVEAVAGWLQFQPLQQILWEIERHYCAVDPLLYLHELLVRQDSADTRRRCGVFYTPAPIVRWMVDAGEQLRQRCFAEDAAMRFIDPACGSGTFLTEVKPHADDAVVGFDILPGTCAVAHTLLAARQRQRAAASPHIACVNPLTAGDELAPLVLGADGKQIPLIVGNPPYANFGRQNRGDWITSLLADYKAGLDEKKLNLDDDFIKFLRWGQYWIERAGRGVLAMITSRTYLDGLTHRAMRGSLASAFDEIYVLDLGGDADAQRSSRLRAEDENVFGIRRGVAIGVFVKTGEGSSVRVRYHRLRGSREEKFDALHRNDLDSTPWQVISVAPPRHPFTPQRRRSSEYASWPRVDELFGEHISGVQTKNDALLTDFDRDTLAARMRSLLSGDMEQTLNREEWLLVDAAREKFGDGLRGVAYDASRLRPYLVAPFDRRWIYYEPRLVGRARLRTMRHLLQPNAALVFMRQSTCDGPYDHFLATDSLASDRVFYSTHGAPFVAPLWRYESTHPLFGHERRPNLNTDAARPFAERIKRIYSPESSSPAVHRSDVITPDDLFHYLYAAVHRTDYRRRFDDELRVDFPRIPLPDDARRFDRLRDLGRRLVALHLNGASQSTPDTSPSREVQEWRVGGYAVLPRWRRQRREQTANMDEQGRLIATIAESIRLVRETDEV